MPILKTPKTLATAFTLACLATAPLAAAAASWTAMARRPPASVETMLLLTDGTVLAHSYDSPGNIWLKLTPDANGNYANGRWTQVAGMGTNRLYFASHVLRSGDLWVLGGEYSGPNLDANWTNTGEWYDTLNNVWTPIAPHPESNFGDVPTMLLDKDRILAGSLFGRSSYLYDIASNRWTRAADKAYDDSSDEETYVKLPGGQVLVYDLFRSIATGGGYAEVYNPKTGLWSGRSPSDGTAAGSIPQLSSPAMGYEIGGALALRSRDKGGRVITIGATGHTALYEVASNTWSAGPDIIGTLPSGAQGLFGAVDAPAAALPNGRVMLAADASPSTGKAFSGPTQLFEYNPARNTIRPLSPTVPVALDGPAFVHRMLVLPTGQVLFTQGGKDVWIYSADGAPPDKARPTVETVHYDGKGRFTLSGRQLTGVNAGSTYGDDAESDENYPIVRFGQPGASPVWYGRTFNWKSTDVQLRKITSTRFTLKTGTPSGLVSLVVSAAGVESLPVCLTLTAEQVAGTGAAADIPLQSCP